MSYCTAETNDIIQIHLHLSARVQGTFCHIAYLYMQEFNNLNNRNSAFVCNLHTNLVLLQLRYYQQHGIEIFSDYLGLILDSDKF